MNTGVETKQGHVDGPSRSRWPIVALLGSTGASVTGNAMVEVLVVWLVLRETGNAAYAGIIGAAALVAVVVSLLFGAALVDRWDRRNLSAGADLLSALAVAALPVIAWQFGLSAATIVILVVIGALFDGPGRSAREALRPAISARSGLSLERTNAFGEVTDGIGNVVGPACAGLAVAAVGLMSSFWIAAALLLVAGIIFLVGLPPSPRPRTQIGQGETESYLDATIDGLKHVWNDPVLRSTSIAASLFGFFLAPVILVFTAAFEAVDQPRALGGLLAAFSIGSIGGALAYAAAGPRLPRRLILIAGLVAMSSGLIAMSTVFDHYNAVVAIAFATGLAAGPLGPIFSVIIQQRTDDTHLGRVLATVGTLELLAAPLSFAITGLVIQTTSATASLAIVGCGCLLATIYTTSTPALRNIEATDLYRRPSDPPATHG